MYVMNNIWYYIKEIKQYFLAIYLQYRVDKWDKLILYLSISIYIYISYVSINTITHYTPLGYVTFLVYIYIYRHIIHVSKISTYIIISWFMVNRAISLCVYNIYIYYIYVYIIYMAMYLSIYLSVCLSIHPSIQVI